MSNDIQSSSKRGRYSKSELMEMHREDLVERFKVLKQCSQIEYLQSKMPTQELVEELNKLKDLVDRQKVQLHEGMVRESTLVMRLTEKDHHTQELMTQIQYFKTRDQGISISQLQGRFLDASVNTVLQHLKKELDEKNKKVETLENDLQAVKFTPDSQLGKRLMAKCRQLQEENDELGKMIESGRVAQLETDLNENKKIIEEMRTSEKGSEELLLTMDDDQEVMQMTIYTQQSEIRKLSERIDRLEDDTGRLRAQLIDHGLRPCTSGARTDDRWRHPQRDDTRKRRLSPDRGRSRGRGDSTDASRKTASAHGRLGRSADRYGDSYGNKRRREDSGDRYYNSDRYNSSRGGDRSRRTSPRRGNSRDRSRERSSGRGRSGERERSRGRSGERREKSRGRSREKRDKSKADETRSQNSDPPRRSTDRTDQKSADRTEAKNRDHREQERTKTRTDSPPHSNSKEGKGEGLKDSRDSRRDGQRNSRDRDTNHVTGKSSDAIKSRTADSKVKNNSVNGVPA